MMVLSISVENAIFLSVICISAISCDKPSGQQYFEDSYQDSYPSFEDFLRNSDSHDPIKYQPSLSVGSMHHHQIRSSK